MNYAAVQTKAITLEEVFSHPPETLWKALTSGALVERWFGMKPVGFVPEVGNGVTYRMSPRGAWDGIIQCEALKVIPDEHFAYS